MPIQFLGMLHRTLSLQSILHFSILAIISISNGCFQRSPTTPIHNKMTSSHTAQQQASTNYKEAFSLFDKRGNGRVSLESLGDLLRACGQNPTLTEIRDLEKTIGGDCTFLAPFSTPRYSKNPLPNMFHC